jgi:MFS transporter, putative metabolite:H+ symporter
MATLLERFDDLPITRLHVFAATLCALALVVDTAEIAIGNALSAILSAPPYKLDPKHISWALSSIYLGAVLGAPLVGWAADRRGIRRCLLVALLWLGISSILTSVSANIAWLTVMRFLAGISVGALPPLLIAFLTGLSPARYRGTMIFWVLGIAYLSPPATLFLIRWLTPFQPFGIEGWRWPFAVSGLLSLTVGIAFKYVPESPKWLISAGKEDKATAVLHLFEGSPSTFRTGRARMEAATRTAATETTSQATPDITPTLSAAGFRRRFGILAVLYFLQPWASVGFPLLTGPILLSRGYDLSHTLLFVAVAAAGPPISTVIVGAVIDRLERRAAMSIFAAFMFLAVVTFFSATSPSWIMVAIVCFGIALALYVPVLTTYAAEVFPAVVRSSTTSAAWAINRIASAIAPVVLLPLLATTGPTAVAVIICCALLGSIFVAISFGPPGHAGRPVG